MRNRVIELVAIVAIRGALFGHIEVRCHGLVSKTPKGLLEIEHCSLIAVTDATSRNQTSAEVSSAPVTFDEPATATAARGT